MKLARLLERTPTLEVSGRAGADVTGIVSDSRHVRPGFMFVAIPGLHTDGWAHVDEAVRRGAVAVVSGTEGSVRRDVCHVRVQDPRRAVAELAGAFYGDPSAQMQLVGVTGTNGKTTTVYMLYEALQVAGLHPGLLSTVEYRIGPRVIPAGRTTPEAPDLQAMFAKMAAAGCASAAMEVSSHALVQKRVVATEFDVGVFTNLTRDHLDYHNTMEEYFEAKTGLFALMAESREPGTSVINTDDPWGRQLLEMRDLHRHVLSYGENPRADVRADAVHLTPLGSTFRVQSPWGDHDFHIHLLGRYNVSNALAAVSACGVLGVKPGVVAEALGRMRHVPGRLEEIETGRDFQVFVDYAHTDDALQHVLTTLREICRGRLILVFGCGGDRDRSKRPAMGNVASRHADFCVITSDNPRSEEPAEIIAQVREGFDNGADFEVIEDRRQAVRRAIETAGSGDIVLVAGKGHENFQELANTTIPFDDRQVVHEILHEMGWVKDHAVV